MHIDQRGSTVYIKSVRRAALFTAHSIRRRWIQNENKQIFSEPPTIKKGAIFAASDDDFIYIKF